LNIKYEPGSLGDCAAILVLTNPDVVEYSCLLYGHSSAPHPYGPIKIMTGKVVNVDVKNPLTEKTEFIFRFDNPSFSNRWEASWIERHRKASGDPSEV